MEAELDRTAGCGGQACLPILPMPSILSNSRDKSLKPTASVTARLGQSRRRRTEIL